jgi:cob(I)alamin adenosyltransferase
MYNRRVTKSDPQVEAYGSVDELNAALGWARAHAAESFVQERLIAVQKELVLVMGELATHPEDLERYVKDGFKRIDSSFPQHLDTLVQEVEAMKPQYDGWATPGSSPASAALEIARTTCRRAERRVHAFSTDDRPGNEQILVYLNRLSDLLWLYARWTETTERK